MTKNIFIKLTKATIKMGPFDIFDQAGGVIDTKVPRETLVEGVLYTVDESVSAVTLTSIGSCEQSVTNVVQDIPENHIHQVTLDETTTGCLWVHNKDQSLYNSYYGKTAPYIIEYPFAYQLKDEIVQNVEEYDKVFKYYQTYLESSDKNNRVQIDDGWFNKAILYNGQQSSGLLELDIHPSNNLHAYMQYPKFNPESKSIIYSKRDNVYGYNTFWNIVKDHRVPLFRTTCESLSIDKVLNQTNMDYTIRSFRKATIRGKDLKVRHILDNRDDINIVTQFIITPSQISYEA